MKIENNTSKAKWVHYKTNGVPKKVFLNAFDSYEERDINDVFQLKLNAHDKSLYEIEDKLGLGFKQRFSISVYDKMIGTSWDNYQSIVGKPTDLQIFSGGTGYLSGRGSLFFSKTTDYGQSWSGVNPSPRTELIYNQHFINELSGVCVSVDGNVFFTTNGTTSWTKKSLPSECRVDASKEMTFGYNSIFAKSMNEVYICPTNGEIVLLRTTDGGNTWESLITTGDTNFSKLQRVKFYNENIGWAVGSGGTIFRTTDGGDNWIRKGSGTTNVVLYSINPINEDCCWIAGSSRNILYTKDGGETWNKTTPATLPDYTIYSHYALPSNGNIQFVVSNVNYCYKSTDSGVTWSNIIPWDGTCDGWSICPVSDNEIYTAAGDAGFFLNKITNLTSYTSVFTAATYSCGGKVDKYFFQLGDGGYARVSEDNGLTWNNNIKYTISDISDCYIIDKNKILTSENSTKFTIIQNEFSSFYIKAVAGLTSGRFIERAPDGKFWIGGTTNKLAYSSDSGATWTSVTGITNPMKIHIIGENIFIGAGSGKMIVSHDNGVSWEYKTFDSGETRSASAIYAIDTNNILIGSSYASVYRTSDGGETWTKLYKNSTYSSIKSFYYDEFTKTLIAITLYGYILTSVNLGETWNVLTKLPTYVWGTFEHNKEIIILGGAGSTFSIKSEYIKII